MKKKVLIIFLFCFLFVFSANAQVRSDDIALSLNPEQPKKNETVVASLSSYVIDLNRALISWSVNNQVMTQAIGQKSFSFRNGEEGFKTNLSVKIETIDGAILNKQITLSSNEVDLLWEALDSYVPPFYKGKALIPQEGSVKMVALMNSENSSGASYRWSVDRNPKINASGFNKNSYIFKKSYLDDVNKIEVSVLDIFGNSLGSNEVEIKNTMPKLLFYKKDINANPDLMQNVKDNFFIKKEGETIILEPFYISPKNLNSSDLVLNWYLGNNEPIVSEIKNELNLIPEKTDGGSKIKVSLENIKTLFLKIDKELNVNF